MKPTEKMLPLIEAIELELRILKDIVTPLLNENYPELSFYSNCCDPLRTDIQRVQNSIDILNQVTKWLVGELPELPPEKPNFMDYVNKLK